MTIDEMMRKFESLQSYDLCVFYHASSRDYHWIFEQDIDGVKIKISKRDDNCMKGLIAVWDEIVKLSEGNKNLKPLMIEYEAISVSETKLPWDNP